MSLIIGIDPGKTTGLVALNFSPGLITPDRYGLLLAQEVTWANRFYFHELFLKYRDQIAYIVIERFILYANRRIQEAQTGSDFPSVRVIGIIDAYAHLLNLSDKLVYQNAYDRRSAKIPPMHFALIPSNHVQDAYRHARYFALLNKGKPI